MKEKIGNCVTLNIHVECDKCKSNKFDVKHDNSCACRDNDHNKEEEENCVEINVFVECDKKKA